MKILAHIHGYPPSHNAGAEWMLHHMLLWLKARGHDIIAAHPDTTVEEFEGIKVVNEFGKVHISRFYKWADIIISHLDKTGKVINRSRAAQRPACFIMHNTHHNSMIDLIAHRSVLCFNSEYTAAVPYYKHKESCIVYPPCPVKYYRTKRGGGRAITIVNHAKKKGADLFHEMARRMPGYDFMAVRGGYFHQKKEDLKNVTYKENTPTIQKQYQVTKVILMPSEYESFGRVAIEGYASGIPCIAAPTPGLKESLGEAGIFVDLEDVDGWEKAIKKLMEDKEYYTGIQKKCRARAAELEKLFDGQMEDLSILMQRAIEFKTKEGRQ
jgi:glycosyltransferase involved in cell wall biosynthesis